MIEGLYSIFNHWHCNGAVWLYSDPHFNDEELAAAIPNRPSAEEQLRIIRSKVGRRDTFICLGDVGDINFVRRIKGFKVLVCGNHDAGASNYKRVRLAKKFDKTQYTRDEAVAEMRQTYPDWEISYKEEVYFRNPPTDWVIVADNNLFDEVYTGPVMIGEKLILSHEPIPTIDWAMNIHGHIHDPKHKNDANHFCVSADLINYTPINFNQWMKQGHLKPIQSLHRDIIDNATKRARKRGHKLGAG